MDSESESKQLNILDLPIEIIENIISHLSYHHVSEARAVCRTFNKHCQDRLNKGFVKVDKLHAQIQKEVKSKLPRRESERRSHPLARHVDILSAIETRISLLGMSYLKYIDAGMCCFIPGKVLDELICILHTLQSNEQPPRSHEFLQELRDISSMAMEHFDEKIVPSLKAKLPAVTLPYPFQQEPSSSVLLTYQTSPMRVPSVRTEINNINTQLRTQSSNSRLIQKDVMENKIGYSNHKKKLLEQEKKIIQQGQAIAELEKKVNDLNQKFVDMSAEIVKLKGVNEARGGNSALSCLKKKEYEGKYEDQGETTVHDKLNMEEMEVNKATVSDKAAVSSKTTMLSKSAMSKDSSKLMDRLTRKRGRDLGTASAAMARKNFKAKKARQ